MKIHLILILFAVISNVNYVKTHKCYVFDSVKDIDYKTRERSIEDNPYYEFQQKVTQESQHKQRNSNSKLRTSSQLIRAYQKGKCSTQSAIISVWVNSNETIFEECSGLTTKTHTSKGGRHKDVSNEYRIRSMQSYCHESCNSSHRRLHPKNFWLNLMLPIVITFANFVFN